MFIMALLIVTCVAVCGEKKKSLSCFIFFFVGDILNKKKIKIAVIFLYYFDAEVFTGFVAEWFHMSIQ